MNSPKSNGASLVAAKERLTKDHFIALRSLAKGRWVQGNPIEWKFNRTWLFVKVTKTSLDAVDTLQTRGLAIKGKCCLKCKRDVYLLTEAGLDLVSQANSPTQRRVESNSAVLKEPSFISRVLYWLGR